MGKLVTLLAVMLSTPVLAHFPVDSKCEVSLPAFKQAFIVYCREVSEIKTRALDEAPTCEKCHSNGIQINRFGSGVSGLMFPKYPSLKSSLENIKSSGTVFKIMKQKD